MNSGRRLLFFAALVALGYGCAQSEPVDEPSGNSNDLSGVAGTTQLSPGVGGTTGAARDAGADGGATKVVADEM